MQQLKSEKIERDVLAPFSSFLDIVSVQVQQVDCKLATECVNPRWKRIQADLEFFDVALQVSILVN